METYEITCQLKSTMDSIQESENLLDKAILSNEFKTEFEKESQELMIKLNRVKYDIYNFLKNR